MFYISADKLSAFVLKQQLWDWNKSSVKESEFINDSIF